MPNALFKELQETLKALARTGESMARWMDPRSSSLVPTDRPVPKIEPSDSWKAKVAAAERTEAFARDLETQLPEEFRPYLRRLIMRNDYIVNIEQILELAVTYRENLGRLWLHDCVPKAEHDEAMRIGRQFEESLRELVARHHEPIAHRLSEGGA